MGFAWTSGFPNVDAFGTSISMEAVYTPIPGMTFVGMSFFAFNTVGGPGAWISTVVEVATDPKTGNKIGGSDTFPMPNGTYICIARVVYKDTSTPPIYHAYDLVTNVITITAGVANTGASDLSLTTRVSSAAAQARGIYNWDSGFVDTNSASAFAYLWGSGSYSGEVWQTTDINIANSAGVGYVDWTWQGRTPSNAGKYPPWAGFPSVATWISICPCGSSGNNLFVCSFADETNGTSTYTLCSARGVLTVP